MEARIWRSVEIRCLFPYRIHHERQRSNGSLGTCHWLHERTNRQGGRFQNLRQGWSQISFQLAR
nr:unnamed protein product [Callosobruchus analis]